MPLKKVLVIGNGFDIAHGLLTSYEDILRIMKDPDDFFRYYRHKIKEESIGIFENNSYWEVYLGLITDKDRENVYRMVNIFKENPWAQYYAKCNAEIDGWVDFEHEMLPVIKLFNYITTKGSANEENCALVRIDDIGISRIAYLWPKYVIETKIEKTSLERVVVKINSKYSDKQYGVLADKLIKDLRSDFDEFVEGVALYLDLFACSDVKLELKSLFETMKVAYIINFNYTGTFYRYSNLCDAEVSYVHGSVTNKENQKMVLGVNRVDYDAEYRFKEFEKRYQRLCNNTKPLYKRIMTEDDYELFFYGHSLDITDKSILEPLIRGAKRTVIYCYIDSNGHSDVNIKKKNLMFLLGDDDTEEMLYNETIIFKQV